MTFAMGRNTQIIIIITIIIIIIIIIINIIILPNLMKKVHALQYTGPGAYKKINA